MRHALIALALFAVAASIYAQCAGAALNASGATDFSIATDISSDTLASEVIPLYGVAMVLFATTGIISRMFRRNRGLLQLQLTRG